MRRFSYSPLLGTTVKLSVTGSPWRRETEVAKRIVAEIARLSAVFNIYEPTSQMSAYRHSLRTSSPEILELAEIAEYWRNLSNGRFDPQMGTHQANLNAIAKGWIVDRAMAAAGSTKALLIDAGGDLLFRGAKPISVGIENPLRPYDNEPPLTTVRLVNQALATSGPSRRADHLVDPRTGTTPAQVSGASVIATDAATADVAATILAVGSVEEGMLFASELGLGALLVDQDGGVHQSACWPVSCPTSEQQSK